MENFNKKITTQARTPGKNNLEILLTFVSSPLVVILSYEQGKPAVEDGMLSFNSVLWNSDPAHLNIYVKSQTLCHTSYHHWCVH